MFLVSEQTLLGGWVKRGKTRMQSLASTVRVSLGCGVKGVSAATVVSVALATRGEIHNAQCRCTGVEWAHFLQTALAGLETVTSELLQDG